MGIGTSEDLKGAGVARDSVFDEGALAPAQSFGVDLLAVLAHMAEVGPEFGSDGRRVAGFGKSAGGEAHGLEILLITRAATEGARKGVGDFRVGRLGRSREEFAYGEGDGRRAVAALDAGAIDEGALDRLQDGIFIVVVDSDDIVALGLGGEDEAGIDEFTVEEKGAEAAGAFAVAAVPQRDDSRAA